MAKQPSQTSSETAEIPVLESDLQVLLQAFRTPFLHLSDLWGPEALDLGRLAQRRRGAGPIPALHG